MKHLWVLVSALLVGMVLVGMGCGDPEAELVHAGRLAGTDHGGAAGEPEPAASVEGPAVRERSGVGSDLRSASGDPVRFPGGWVDAPPAVPDVRMGGADHAVPLFQVEADVDEEGGFRLTVRTGDDEGVEKAGSRFPELGACELRHRIFPITNMTGTVGAQEACALTPAEAEYYRNHYAICVRVEINNPTSRSYERIFAVVDEVNPQTAGVFSGSRMSDPPRTVEYPDGTVEILDPWSQLGTYDYGPLARSGQGAASRSAVDWVFLMTQQTSSINMVGTFWAVLHETCGNNRDDNCDGLRDSGCGLFGAGESCLRHSDSAEGLLCDTPWPGQLGTCVEVEP